MYVYALLISLNIFIVTWVTLKGFYMFF